jgi:hypothetical protein
VVIADALATPRLPATREQLDADVVDLLLAVLSADVAARISRGRGIGPAPACLSCTAAARWVAEHC